MKPQIKTLREALKRRAEPPPFPEDPRGDPLPSPEPPPGEAVQEERRPLTRGQMLSRETGLPYVDLDKSPPDKEVMGVLPEWIVRHFVCIPYAKRGDEYVVATSNPYDLTAHQEIKRHLPKIRFVIAEEEAIRRHAQSYLNAVARETEALKEISQLLGPAESEQAVSGEDSAIVKLVNGLIDEAVMLGASDVHIEPMEKEGPKVRVRFRVDGELRDKVVYEGALLAPIVSRIKVMANLNISEKRLPQDGQIAYTSSTGKRYKVRVSVIPSYIGESVVLRILPGSGNIPTLKSLGFLEDTLNLYRGLIRKPYGLILVTGPTGSGKTTTLFASLREILRPELKVITVEDPVEYEIPEITQIPVQPEIGRTFSRVLRSILRHDPDIIVVGEIRDAETARIAAEAAMTGHLVLATLHTNDSTSAPARLVEMGVEPYLLTNLLGVLSQRLAKRVCPYCAAPYTPNIPELPKGAYRKGKGCERCGGTGYKGRIAIHELLVVNEAIQSGISKRMGPNELRAIALKAGLRSLREDGLIKAANGLTTPEEVVLKTLD